jgi:hypothetical protein
LSFEGYKNLTGLKRARKEVAENGDEIEQNNEAAGKKDEDQKEQLLNILRQSNGQKGGTPRPPE